MPVINKDLVKEMKNDRVKFYLFSWNYKEFEMI